MGLFDKLKSVFTSSDPHGLDDYVVVDADSLPTGDQADVVEVTGVEDEIKEDND